MLSLSGKCPIPPGIQFFSLELPNPNLIIPSLLWAPGFDAETKKRDGSLGFPFSKLQIVWPCPKETKAFEFVLLNFRKNLSSALKNPQDIKPSQPSIPHSPPKNLGSACLSLPWENSCDSQGTTSHRQKHGNSIHCSPLNA